jgi:3-oxoacyl-[acyl-carrier-protein] synthase III
MAVFGIPRVKFSGIAASVPQNEVSNFDCELLDEKERKLFVRSVGIEKRRVADKGICASDLCEKAATELLKELQWKKETIDILIFVTQTPDYITPSTSILLQEKLGLKKSCLAFDINLGCSGYVYGLSVLGSLLSNMPGSKGLLLVGDVSSACISPNDKSTVPLFSDAGSATALEYNDASKNFYFNLESDGKGYEAIIIPEGGYRNPVTVGSLEMKEIEKGIVRNGTHLILRGIDIFNFSVREVPQNIAALMKQVNVSKDEVDFLLLHQANKIINDAIAGALNFPDDKVPSSLRHYGNTSSASIPVTMVVALQEKLQTKKLNLLLSGFGVGLSWGSVMVETENIVCPSIVEV